MVRTESGHDGKHWVAPGLAGAQHLPNLRSVYPRDSEKEGAGPGPKKTGLGAPRDLLEVPQDFEEKPAGHVDSQH